MNIAEGLKEIIETKGRDIIGTPICYNILWDLGVFKNSIGYKNIFRSILNDGYMEKMLSLTQWNEIISQWSLNLSNQRGFNKEWTTDIFFSIAKALNLCPQIKTYNSDLINSLIEFDYVPKKSSSSYEAYYNSTINIVDVIKEGQEHGVIVTNFHLRVRQYAWQLDQNVPYGYIDVSLELSRIKKLKRIRKLWIALYSYENAVIKKFSIGEMRNDDSHFKPCIGSTGVDLDKVAKIVLFWS